jgi:hypothetical protein
MLQLEDVSSRVLSAFPSNLPNVAGKETISIKTINNVCENIHVISVKVF